jgi:hypothetical protein
MKMKGHTMKSFLWLIMAIFGFLLYVVVAAIPILATVVIVWAALKYISS